MVSVFTKERGKKGAGRRRRREGGVGIAKSVTIEF